MYGPAVRSKKIPTTWRWAVLHQCIRPLLGARCAPGHHGYQRACDLISGQASSGLLGSPVFACAGKTDPPSSSHPLADLGGQISISYVIDLFLCSCLVAVPSSRPAGAQARRAQGPSRLAVAMTLRLAPMFPGHALTGLSTVRRSSSSGRSRIGLDALEGASLVENRPGDTGQLVGERNRQDVAVQSLFGRLDPRLA